MKHTFQHRNLQHQKNITEMNTKIVYVVYGSSVEIRNLITWLAEHEFCFSFSGEYLYFSYDPSELIQEAGMDLKVVVEHWAANCFGFKEAPKDPIQVERNEEIVKTNTTIKVDNLSSAARYMDYFKNREAVEIRDLETRKKGGRKYRIGNEVVYLYQA